MWGIYVVRLMNLRISLVIAFLLSVALSGTAHAAEQKRLTFTVICSEAALTEKLNSGISERLSKANIEVSDRFPQGKLFLLVSRDVNDRKNKNGVSVAIAHVSNIQTAVLASGLIKDKKGEPSELLMSMLREEGFLQHLNVAHMDEASDEQIGILLDTVVATFLEKYPDPEGG